jgi:hypothetical protein
LNEGNIRAIIKGPQGSERVHCSTSDGQRIKEELEDTKKSRIYVYTPVPTRKYSVVQKVIAG